MSPSPTRRKWFHLIGLLTLLLSSAFAFGSDDSDDILTAFYGSSHIFQTAPTEGITLVSSNSSSAYLVNGITEDIVSTFIFMPPSGTSPEKYTIAFSCDSDMISTSDDCVVSNALAEIIGTTDLAYNTTVSCSFDRFPGDTTCILTATLTSSVRSESSSMDSIDHQTSFYESPSISIAVYGVVFYIPDDSGGISADATVVSGSSAYEKESYDRNVQGVQEILVFVSVPGSSPSTGASALSFLSSATVSTVVQDHIFNYNETACSVTDAAFTNGVIALSSASTCGIGFAVENEDSNPTMGFQFRAYKSGNFTYKMSWDSFGDSEEAYEQNILFSIAENAPPVITSLDKRNLYRSVPCESELLVLTAYNVRYADSRTIVVKNSDDTTETWSETADGFVYDSDSDTSTITLESAGGLGTNVDFTFVADFGGDERTGVVLDSSISLRLSFSTPPTLSNMSPSTTQVDGGEDIVLTGSFEGFDSESFVYIGGYPISGSDLSIDSSTQITFRSPALASLGMPYNYEVTVGICAETSSSLTLSYEVSPSITITAVNSSSDDTGAYIVPSNDTASFLAEVSGNNDGTEYVWKIFTSSGSEVNTGSTITNLQLFTLSSSLLSSDETYQMQCEVKNSLDLTEADEVNVVLAEEGNEYMTVNVYTIENLTRSADSVTLVQSSVQVTSSSGVRALQSTNVSLEWSYSGNKFQVDDSSADSSVSGPTQLGLEFNIARTDLRVGNQDLKLFAYFTDRPSINASDTITINVVNSELLPVINNGVNGTLILEGKDLQLTAGNSTDPDILEGEGDSSDGLEYEWISCVKSLKSSFSSGVSDCTDILPKNTNSGELTILASDLSNARLDISSDPDPTYFSFGLRVSKNGRVAEAFAYFALWTVAVPEKIPTLSSLQVVDIKGGTITSEATIFADIIVQPESSDDSVSWSFDMALASQKFLFSKSGVLKAGNGFVSSRGISSRNLLGFAASSLNPSTEYKVKVSVTATNTSLESEYEVSFRTADVPTLKCTPPHTTVGTVSETRFTVTAQLSFEAQSVEYCFLLVSSPTQKYTVGKGCSSVPFAEFSFPLPGEYEIECVAKTVSGAVISNIVLPDKIALSTPIPETGITIFQTLSDRLSTLNALATSCESARDHTCIETLIAGASSFAIEVADATQGDDSEESLSLIESCKAYFARMSLLSSNLATKTVYRPNQLMDSIDQAYYMSQVPPEFVEADATLFAYLKSAEIAVNATEGDSSEAIVNNILVDKVSGIANLSLSTSSNIAQEGTTRRRLLQNENTIRHSFGAVLNMAARSIAAMRAQQETCGYSGTESTEFPSSLGGKGRPTSIEGNDIPPLQVLVQVSCTRSQISQKVQGSKVALAMCEEAIAPTDTKRIVMKLVGVPKSAIESTGLFRSIKSYVEQLAYIELEGILSVPGDCLQIIMERSPSTLISTDYDDLVGGVLENIPKPDTTCTPHNCYVFDLEANPKEKVTFSDKQVIIRSDREGLFVGGNKTELADVPAVTLEGLLSSVGTQFLAGLAIILVFIILVVLFVWLSVANVRVAGMPDTEDTGNAPIASTAWEYVERDPFAREQRKNSLFTETDISTTIPEGAKPPVSGPLPLTPQN